MANGIDGLLNTAKSSLNAQSQAIRVIGNNIANVNTEGYNRRRIDLSPLVPSNLSESSFGAGVTVEGVTRIADQFIDNTLLTRIAERSKSEARSELLSRAETPFSLDDSIQTIGTALTDFFNSIEDLKLDPSDTGLRTKFINKGQELTKVIRDTSNIISSLQREADDRIKFSVGEINRLSSDIASLNQQIAQTENSNQDNLTLRDQREQSLRELSELVSFKTIENSEGELVVYLENGFSLVAGSNVRNIEYTVTPSFGNNPPGLDGSLLGSIVYDYDSNPAVDTHIDLTGMMAAGEGKVAGLLAVRGVQSSTDTTIFDAQGDLIELGKRLEAISLHLLTNFNKAFRGDDTTTAALEGDDPLTLTVIEGEAVRRDVSGNPEKVAEAFPAFGVSGLTDAQIDADANQDPNYTNDLQNLIVNPPNITSFARLIDFRIAAPYEVATALDADNTTPAIPEIADGDARNLDRMLAVRDSVISLPAGALGTYVPGENLQGVYTDLVSLVGGVTASAKADLDFRTQREDQAKALRGQVSEVSIDEEFANLIDFQRVFEGSARMIRIGDELFQELVNIL